MIEKITTIRNQNGIKAKSLIFLDFIRVRWYFLVSIYTVVRDKRKIEKIFFRKWRKALILLGFKVVRPFFLLCIDI